LGSDETFGLCPSKRSSDDVVVNILGCGTFLILRPHVNGAYLVVGEAYHVKHMYRESMLHRFLSVLNEQEYLNASFERLASVRSRIVDWMSYLKLGAS